MAANRSSVSVSMLVLAAAKAFKAVCANLLAVSVLRAVAPGPQVHTTRNTGRATLLSGMWREILEWAMSSPSVLSHKREIRSRSPEEYFLDGAQIRKKSDVDVELTTHGIKEHLRLINSRSAASGPLLDQDGSILAVKPFSCTAPSKHARKSGRWRNVKHLMLLHEPKRLIAKRVRPTEFVQFCCRNVTPSGNGRLSKEVIH
jgi:hypothetical protein